MRRFVAEQTADVASLVPSLDVEPGGHRVVTNVVLHARTDFEVRLLRRDGVVRLEVQDGSSALLRPGTLADTAMSGRGLMMVQALASRWGVEHLPAGASSSGASLGGEVDPAEVGAEQAGAGVDG
nr:ATP-binding protein [Angustibacter aerolatus]